MRWPSIFFLTCLAAALSGVPEIQIKSNTPYPCKRKEEYTEGEIQSFVSQHIKGFEPVKGKDKYMLLLLGGSGSGKTTLIREMRKVNPNFKEHFIMHGLDEYLEYLPEYKKSMADKAIVYKDAADDCMPACIRTAIAAQQEIISKGLSVIYEETGKSLERIRDRVLPPFLEAGYKIFVAFVVNTPQNALDRARIRFKKEGRHADAKYILGTFQNLHRNYREIREFRDVEPISLYCDNTCQKYKIGQNPCMQCWDARLTDTKEKFLNMKSFPFEAPGDVDYLDEREGYQLEKFIEEIDEL